MPKAQQNLNHFSIISLALINANEEATDENGIEFVGKSFLFL